MFGLLAAGIAAAAGVYGHIKSRSFVGQRLRYTKVVETPALGLWTGVGTAVVVAALPVVGVGAAAVVGLGVGTGTALGQRDAKEPPKLLDD